MTAVPYVVVATHAGGDVRARQVQLLAVGDDLGVTFATSPRSRKVADIVRAGRATVVAEVLDRLAYVSLTGAAVMIDDPDELRRHWVDELAPIFPGGPDGDDYTLVNVRTDRVELMDFTADIVPPPYGLVPAVAQRDPSGRWDVIAAERSESSVTDRT